MTEESISTSPLAFEEQLVSQLLRQHLKAPVNPLRGGYNGLNYLVESPSGRLVCKVRYARAPLDRCSQASRILARRRISHGRAISRPFQLDQYFGLLLEYIAGEPLSTAGTRLSSTAAASVGEDLGRWLRAVHAIRLPSADWAQMADARFGAKLHEATAGHLLTASLASRLVDTWRELFPALERAPVSLVHRDLQDTNIILSNGSFAGVIDFEQVRVLDPFYDFVKLRDSVFPHHPSLAERFLVGYGYHSSEEGTARLRAASMLEYLSAVVYFYRRREHKTAARNIRALQRLLRDPHLSLAQR